MLDQYGAGGPAGVRRADGRTASKRPSARPPKLVNAMKRAPGGSVGCGGMVAVSSRSTSR